jgi:hypothetical protein
MLTTLIFGFASIVDDIDFELFSKKLKMLTKFIVGGDYINSHSSAYLNLYLPP